MHREYHRWFSSRLQRDMELLVFGHSGAKVLVFPTRDGRFHEYEDLRLVNSLAGKIDAGKLQLWCPDSVAWESFYCFWCHLSSILHAKGIGHRLHVWDGRAHRGNYWREMARLYV